MNEVTVDLQLIDSLSPQNCYYAISRRVSERFVEFPAYTGDGNFLYLRNLVVSLAANGRVIENTLNLYDPPIKRTGDTDFHAEFVLESAWANDGGASVFFDCKLVGGSPRGNFAYTLILSRVYRADEFKQPKPKKQPQPKITWDIAKG